MVEFFRAAWSPVLSGAVSGAFVVFLFQELIKYRIKSKYDKELEQLRAASTMNASVVSAVQKSFSDSYNIAHSKRIQSIRQLWEALLHVKRNSPAVFQFLDVLLPGEYGEVLGSKQLQTFSDISADDIKKMFEGKVTKAEDQRLWTGDYLWSLFWAYQALCVRIAALFLSGRATHNVEAWYMDEVCLSIVRSVCASSEFAEFEKQQIGKIKWIQNLIELKFLLTANKILNGQTSSDIAIDEAAKIMSAVAVASQREP